MNKEKTSAYYVNKEKMRVLLQVVDLEESVKVGVQRFGKSKALEIINEVLESEEIREMTNSSSFK